jgi:predicted acetyltransferase
MEIRKIRPEERLEASKVSTVAFLGQMEPTYREDYASPTDKDNEDCEKIWAAFNDAGKMVSLLYIHEFDMNYDGHAVKMGGIGGVSTLPEARVGGYMRRINEKVMPHMREQGILFSVLFPFSFAFYRKFGYELCYTPNRLRIPMHYFAHYPFPGNITMCEPEGDIKPLHEVYSRFVKDKNYAIVRDFDAMKRRVDNDPYVGRVYTYIHRDENNNPDAYIIYRPEKSDGGNNLQVRELCWTTPKGLHAMFGFVGGLATQFSFLKWDAPYGFNPYPLFPESYELDFERHSRGMNRIMHVPKAFELMKAPQKAGKTVINVKDNFMPINDGNYKLEWENGVITSVNETSAEADLETDVETLAQLVTGYLTPDEARYKRSVNIKGNEAALKALFPHKDMFMMDFF